MWRRFIRASTAADIHTALLIKTFGVCSIVILGITGRSHIDVYQYAGTYATFSQRQLYIPCGIYSASYFSLRRVISLWGVFCSCGEEFCGSSTHERRLSVSLVAVVMFSEVRFRVGLFPAFIADVYPGTVFISAALPFHKIASRNNCTELPIDTVEEVLAPSSDE